MNSKSGRKQELLSILGRTNAKVVKSRRRRYHTPGSPTKSKRKSVKRSMRMGMKKSAKCQKLLGKKIGINMAEYKQGRYTSPKQAIAVAYSQVRKDHPGCKSPITKSRKKSRRPAKKSSGRKMKRSVRR